MLEVSRQHANEGKQESYAERTALRRSMVDAYLKQLKYGRNQYLDQAHKEWHMDLVHMLDDVILELSKHFTVDGTYQLHKALEDNVLYDIAFRFNLGDFLIAYEGHDDVTMVEEPLNPYMIHAHHY